MHAAFWGEGSHPKLEVGNHMEHGGSPEGVAAIVGRIAIEELLKMRMPGFAVPIVEFACQRKVSP